MKLNLTLAVLTCLIAILLTLTYAALLKQKDLNQQKDSIINEKEAKIQYHINENGRIVAEKVAAEASVKEITKAYPQLAHQLQRDFDIKIKNLKTYIRNEFEVRGSGEAQVTNKYYDTARTATYRKLNFSDGYLSFESFIDSTNTAMASYSYRDTVTTTIYSKKKWLFGKERIYGASTFANKNAKSNVATNILVKARDKRFVIMVGGYYDPFKKQYGTGIHLGYSLIRF